MNAWTLPVCVTVGGQPRAASPGPPSTVKRPSGRRETRT